MTYQSFDLNASSLRLIAAHDRLTEHLDTTMTVDDVEKMLLATHRLAQLQEDLMLEVLFHDLMHEASAVLQSAQIS